MEQESAAAPVQTIASRVREARNRKGFTAQELADRLQSSGLTWDRGTVTKLETGRRQNVSVMEWLALARALDVSPLHLLVPLEEVSYQVTPQEEQPAARVRDWIRGVDPLPGMNQRIYFSEVPMAEMKGRFRRLPSTEEGADGEQEHRETPER